MSIFKFNYSIKGIFIFFLFSVLVLFVLTEFLDTLPVYVWDESRQAANAIEMYSNHNWLVTHYDGIPDMWNTKPPLLIWLQVCCMHIFGITVTALRTPSVIAAYVTCCVLFYFIKKNTGNLLVAFLSGLVLVSMQGFNGFHVARTGDYDALLTLFTLLFIIQFYYYVQTRNRKNILLFFVFLCMASLTKGIASLLFMPGLLIYILLSKKIMSVLKDPFFYIGCAGYILIIASYYILREQFNPGYLAAVYENELTGRYLKVNEGHNGNLFSYIKLLSSVQTYFWFDLFLLCIAIYPFVIKKFDFNKLFQYFLLLTICFFIVLTSSKTIIDWYSAPALPLLACMCVLLVFNYSSLLAKVLHINFYYKNNNIVAACIISILTGISYVNIAQINRRPTYKEAWDKEFYAMSNFFHENAFDVSKLHLKVIDHSNINQHLFFYIQRLKLSKCSIDFGDYKHLKPGEAVITHSKDISAYIKRTYSTNELYNKDGVYIFAIK